MSETTLTGLIFSSVLVFGSLADPVYGVPAANGVPSPDHVVIVIEENHSYSEIIGSSAAPYINSVAAQGALFTQSHATTHPSQPNYVAAITQIRPSPVGNCIYCNHCLPCPEGIDIGQTIHLVEGRVPK